MASPTVRALVERWEAARKRGLELTLEELCANCPELLDQRGTR
ncbi:MAG: hypothetical protein U0840_10420 [Gemmataceae bacterium]